MYTLITEGSYLKFILATLFRAGIKLSVLVLFCSAKSALNASAMIDLVVPIWVESLQPASLLCGYESNSL